MKSTAPSTQILRPPPTRHEMCTNVVQQKSVNTTHTVVLSAHGHSTLIIITPGFQQTGHRILGAYHV